MPTESHFVALDPRKFQDAMKKVIMESMQDDPQPQKRGFFRRDRPKKKKALMQAAQLLYTEFPNQDELKSATTRLQALFNLLGSGSVNAWVVQAPNGGSQIHLALIHAAAQAPLGKKGEFVLEELFATAETLKAELEA